MTRPANPNQGTETFQYRASGMSNVLEYQASGLPYATSSLVEGAEPNHVAFPFVTKFFTVKNNGPDELCIGFTRNGVLGSNKFSLPVSASFSGDIRVTSLFIVGATAMTASYEVIAGLTQIPQRNFLILTGALNGFSGSQSLYGDKGFGFDGIG